MLFICECLSCVFAKKIKERQLAWTFVSHLNYMVSYQLIESHLNDRSTELQ